MEKINKAQAFANQDKASSYMLAKKTLEINPHHPVIKKMLTNIRENNGEIDEETSSYTDLLFNIALINSGFTIENPTEVAAPIHKLLKMGFGLEKDAEVEEIEIDIEDDDEEVGEDVEDEEGDVEVEEISHPEEEAEEEEESTEEGNKDEL